MIPRRYRVYFYLLTWIAFISTISIFVSTVILGIPNLDSIIDKRFHIAVNTIDCSREFASISKSLVPHSVYALNDTVCETGGIDNIRYRYERPLDETNPGYDNILHYKFKYTHALEQCKNSGKMLCLILEDDAVLINYPLVAKFRLVFNTLSWYTNDLDTWDCSKLGLPWFSSTHTGNKSVCRILPVGSIDCILREIKGLMWPCDLALSRGTQQCQLNQKRFLWVQHGGGKSTLGH